LEEQLAIRPLKGKIRNAKMISSEEIVKIIFYRISHFVDSRYRNSL
jgi:hypothetical protein